MLKWYQYYEEEPFGSERDNWHMSVLASLYVNHHRARGQPKANIHDFMYKPEKETRKLKTKSVLANLDAMAKRK